MRASIDEITVGDEPESWRAAGFTVDDDGVCRIGRVRVRLVGRSAGKRIRGWSLRGAGDGDLDGVTTAASEREPCEPAGHPNGTELIDHVVLMTPDLERTSHAVQDRGLDLLRTRESDTYGAPMSQHFFRLDEVVLELVGAPDTRGEGPARFFGLAHTVADLDTTHDLLRDHLGRVKSAVQPGRRIVTLRHEELDMSVPTAFMSR